MTIRYTNVLGALLFVAVVGCSSKEAAAGYESKAVADAASPTMAGEAGPTANSDKLDVEATKRFIVRNASMTLRVDDANKTLKDITKLIKSNRGFVQTEQSRDMESTIPVVAFTVRVPVDKLDTIMDQVEKLGTLRARNVTSDDVTTKVVDMDSRVKTMLAREEAYRQILKQCRKVVDVMTVQEHLTTIRTEIESIQAQLKSLKEESAYSTLNIQLEQSAMTATLTKDKGWLGETWANAFTALKDGLKGIAQFMIWLLMLSPFWGIPLLLIWWLARYASRKTHHPSPPTPPSSDPVDPPPFVS